MTAPPIRHSDETMEEGRARLKAWLPVAREEARRDGLSVTSMTALARAQRPYVTESNLDALVIYPAPLGGWHADVLLKFAPAGVANSLGTPSHTPCRTRSEAEMAARSVLAFCLMGDVAPGAKPEPQPPTFLLHGWAFPLQSDALALGRHLEPDRDGAIARIEAVLAVLCPEGFDGDDFNCSWPAEDQGVLMAALHRAALSGILAFPLRYEASPSGHREPDHRSGHLS